MYTQQCLVRVDAADVWQRSPFDDHGRKTYISHTLYFNVEMSADLPSHPVVSWKYCSTDRAELTFRQCTCTTAGKRRSKKLGSPKVERRSPHERAWVHRRITSKITTDSPVGDLTRRPFICRPTPWLRQEFARMFQQVLAEFTRPHFTLPPQREHSLTITSRIIPPPLQLILLLRT